MLWRYLLGVVLIAFSSVVFAYEPQFTVGGGVAKRGDAYRYNVESEFYSENLMVGSLFGIWPRLELDSDGDAPSLFLNCLTFAGIANLEYGYSSGFADGPHSYGVEFNSRFIPAVLFPQISARGDRLVRNIEFYYRIHQFFGSDRRFKQIGVRLTFHFPGFKISEENQ